MTIIPQPNIVYLKFPEVSAGVLDTSSRASAAEYAEVIAIGPDITTIKPGDRVFVKSWAVDTVTHEEKTYRFCNVKTGGILAILD